jgi:hypothetical protein
VPPGPPGRIRRRSGVERRREQLDFVSVLRPRAFDQADRGERDVDQVEFVRERLHDAAEPVETVAEERLPQVGAQDLGPSLAQVGDRR